MKSNIKYLGVTLDAQLSFKYHIDELTKKISRGIGLLYKFQPHALKQHMPKKPIRFGYKVWCLNLEGGYLYDFNVYQGKSSQNKFSEKFGCGPSVVL